MQQEMESQVEDWQQEHLEANQPQLDLKTKHQELVKMK